MVPGLANVTYATLYVGLLLEKVPSMFQYMIDGHVLKRVDEYKYLGVIFADLKFNIWKQRKMDED